MSHERFDDLAPVYALGALDGDEAVEFERHLAGGCERCQAVLDDAHEAFATLARSGERVAPPPHVREALMERVGAASRQRLPIERRRSWLRWAGATAACVVAASALTAAYVAARYEARLGVMARETARLREGLLAHEHALEQQLAATRAVVDLLRDPATRVVALRGAGPSPQATGRVVWHPSAGGEVFVANLPAPPADRTYELWTIAGGAPKPAGLLALDATGRGTARLEPTGGPVDVFAVTLEPAGGTSAPTGPIVLASAK
ncbi:MAG: anti-sigma factor [Candidatus Rokubacteria bacterium]|nr:anti-sigma factor [Candidatus Rokubacteria bacterium]MBI3827823.1 anti-sigma factor [Candidatus Rokubacteria bacterium]